MTLLKILQGNLCNAKRKVESQLQTYSELFNIKLSLEEELNRYRKLLDNAEMRCVFYFGVHLHLSHAFFAFDIGFHVKNIIVTVI